MQATTADQLSLLADRFQLTHPGAAAGRCLSASLDFALAAKREHGVDVQLVKWRVVGDPNYGDHWAIALDAARVLDLTHLQVDANLPLIGAITRYPGNFLAPRQYPASLLLGDYAANDPGEARLSLDFLWSCGTRLLRFDLAAALRNTDTTVALATLAEFGRFLLRFHAQRLSRALERRAHTLLQRLSVASPPSQGEGHGPAYGAPGMAGEPSPSNGQRVRAPEHFARVGQAFTPALTAHINSACSFLLAWASLAPAG